MKNLVQLTGNIGQDPQVFDVQNGKTKLLKFSMATNESYKDGQDNWVTHTEWHNIEAWGPLAERMSAQLAKGSSVSITGRLRNSVYEDKDGIKRAKTSVRADEFLILKPTGSSKAMDVKKEPAKVAAK